MTFNRTQQKRLKDYFDFNDDFIRLRKEFEHGRFELEITNKQVEWLQSIIKSYSTHGMYAKCNENTANFLKKIFDLLNAMGY